MSQKIEIPLRSNVDNEDRKTPAQFRSVVEREYYEKYLTSVGANPSRENVEFVRKNASISGSTILPVWVKDTLVILPNRTESSGKIDLAEIFKADVITNDDSSVYFDITKQNRKEGATEKRKSVKEVRAVQPVKHFREVKIDYLRKNLSEDLLPLIKEMTAEDIAEETFKALSVKIDVEENMVFAAIQEFLSLLLGFVPFLKDSRRLGEETPQTKARVTQILSKLLASSLFLEFYESFYKYCYQRIVQGCSVLAEERLLSINQSHESEPDYASKSQYDHEDVDDAALLNIYERCMEVLRTKLGFKVFSLKAANQGFVYATCFTIINLLRKNYRWLRPEFQCHSDRNDQLRKNVNKLLIRTITRLVDPNHLYPKELFFLKNGEVKNAQLERNFIDRKTIRNIQGRQYTTSLPIRATFSGVASSGETRKMLQKSMGAPDVSDRVKKSLDNQMYKEIDNGPWKVPPNSGVRLPTMSIRERHLNAKARRPSSTDGSCFTLSEINELFESYNRRLKTSTGNRSQRDREYSPTHLSANALNHDSRTHGKSEHDLLGLFVETPSLDPSLSHDSKRDMLRASLAKVRSQYCGKDEKEEPRIGLFRWEYLSCFFALLKYANGSIMKTNTCKNTLYTLYVFVFCSAIDTNSQMWWSKGTRTGILELGFDNTKYPTRPPSRETPIIDLTPGRKTSSPVARFKLPL